MNLLSKIYNSSIKTKVVTLTMLVVSFVITVALVLMLLIQYLEMKQVLVNETSNLTRIIANRSSLAVSFMDEEVALESLNALADSQNIQQVAIFDLNGNLFVSYKKDGATVIANTQRTQEGIYDNFSEINITRNISEGDEVLGYLFLQSDLSPVWRGLGLSLAYTIILYILCLLVSFLLSVKLQRYITVPILSLLETSRRISSEHNYEIRAQKDRNDEVGMLVDQFNEMLSIIHGNEKVLKNANEDLEQQVEKRTEDLAKALQESQAANHAKSVFLSHMSHELRTPLNAINGYSQILVRQKNLTVAQRKQLETIYKCGDHLLHLINDVLDYSHIEAGHFEVENAPFNLLQILRRVSDMMRLQADQKDLYFDFIASDGLPETVTGDGRRISQVLLNILSNAIKYTVKGTIHFRVYPEGASHIVFEVTDTGVGIPEEIRDQVFSPFFRASNTKKMVDGLGLGMAISKEFVSLMNGEIELESEEGVGSTFRVRLPLEKTSNEAMSNSLYRYIAGYKGQKKKLLLVDDNVSNLAVLVSLLEPINFEVRTVEDGSHVCQAVDEFAPDALLLDLIMPDIDGLEVLKNLEGISYQGKVIGISATAIETNLKNDFTSKCDYFLTKPINADELVRTLELLFNLEWELNNEVSSFQNQGGNLGSEAYKLPPTDIIQELRVYVEEGNFSTLTKSLEIFCEQQPEYADFYKEALFHAEGFDDESLMKILPSI
ncbi:MAG: ATP-binding protein [Opitutaceae bacterium]